MSSGLSSDVRSDFETLYRETVRPVVAFFARRGVDAQAVADLTAETFTEAIGSYGSFDAARGSQRGWIFGIAHHVYAQHVQGMVRQRETQKLLAEQRQLSVDEIAELEERIDAERRAREVLAQLSELPETDRSAIELVDVMAIPAREAAAALGISYSALRVRLSRARRKLRRGWTGAHHDFI